MKHKWLLELTHGKQQVEADEVEITVSGALVFYRSAGRPENERSLLFAWSPGSWQHCHLQGSH